MNYSSLFCKFLLITLEHDVIPNRTEIKARINERTIVESFKNLLEEFKKMDSTYTMSELVKNTEIFIKQRLLYKNIRTSLEEVTAKYEINEARVIKEFETIQSISLLENLGMDFFLDTDEFVSKLERQDVFISTGYEWLDRELGGGIHKEGRAMYGVAGETNVGKSIVLGNIGANVLLQGYNLVVITLEMSEFRYAKRLASMLSRIPQIELPRLALLELQDSCLLKTFPLFHDFVLSLE
jgi:replicative DNA helicase